ncbi:MAG: nucleoside recognition domain-containing protein [Eubacteriales bacterium]|nr:nucleoside recognition domain-containing protein [Eubacteriales bacterium]
MEFGKYYLSMVRGIIGPFCSEDSFWGNLLIGQYGIFTMTPAYLFGLLLPLVAGFYFLRNVLDDSCLFPRIAVLFDRPFRLLGLNGNAIVPILLGFGCVTVALVSTTILGSRRERLIASALLCIAVPCSAQIAIIVSFAFLLDFRYFLLYFLVISGIFLLLGLLLNLLLPGTLQPETLPTPRLRLPNFKKIIKNTAGEAVIFLRSTVPAFLIGGIVIAILDYYNGFMKLREWCAPITVELLKVPENAANLFVMSIIKRDLGAAAFYSMVSDGSFTQKEILITLIVLTLFVPCFASQMILFKQGKALFASLIWVGSFLVAFSAGGFVSWLVYSF